MKKTWTRILSVLLTVLMVSALAVPSMAAGSDNGWRSVSFEKVDAEVQTPRATEEAKEAESMYKANDVVRVSIVLNGKSTIEKGFSAEGIAQNEAAKSYRASLKAQQDRVAETISKFILGGEKLDVVWNITLAANIISANVKYGQIEAIKGLPAVKDVVIEVQYLPEEVVESDDPNMTTASIMTSTNYVWGGFNGAGQSVAVIDTGIAYDHELFDPEAFEYAIAEDDYWNDTEADLITVEDIDAVLDQLNSKVRTPDLTAEDLYLNAKIPYAYNYVDKDLDVSHANDKQGEHGSHVSGIATGNRYVKDPDGGFAESLDAVFTQGQAPDAQLLTMKVFGKGGGAYDSDYFVAIEDAIVLGAAAANLSLGSRMAGFSAVDSTYAEIIEELYESDTLMVNSAGNNGSWADNTMLGYLYGEDKNLATGGSPGTGTQTISVASVDNLGFTGASMKFYDRSVFYSETSDYGNEPLTTLTGEYEFVLVDGPGVADNDYSGNQFAEIGSEVLKGKVAICKRGSSSFFAKANAAVAEGAVAVVIFNNQAGTINMNLTGYLYNAPAVSITQEDGEFIIANAEAVKDGEGNVLYYTGKMNMPNGIEVDYSGFESGYATMSDFSAWGVPGSLELKPEITAPGGNIYSINGYHLDTNGSPAGGSDQYENLSGTSMAAPQITGIAAIMKQYIEAYDLEEITGLTSRQLAHSLLMSTATPLVEEESGYYYSVLKQGAGLVDVRSAVMSYSAIIMNEDATKSASDGKVKAEIGVLPRGENQFSFSFDLINYADYDYVYLLDADFFTQNYFAYYVLDDEGNPIVDGDQYRVAYYTDTWTAPLDFDVAWKVNGEDFVPADIAEYDLNEDGIVNSADATYILDYVVGNYDEIPEIADIDKDGEIDTYDAHLLLDMIKKANVNLESGERATITVTVTLNDIDDWDLNGAYIEGYVYVAEQDTYDGAIGAVHSIPVLGFYGDWSEPSMFDHGFALDYYHYTEFYTPYMAVQNGENAYLENAFYVYYTNEDEGYVFAGNPYLSDEVYMPERDAVNGGDLLSGVSYSQIRNSAAGRIVVTDEEGNELFKKDLGSTYATYYYSTDAEWKSTVYTQNIGIDFSGLEEGTRVNAAVQLAPEYYVVNGEVDWDALADGSKFTTSFEIDNTAPELSEVEIHYDEEAGIYDAIRFKTSDNNYVAITELCDEYGDYLDYFGADPDVEKGATLDGSFDLTEYGEYLPAHLMIFVADYACNSATYKINLNTDELDDPITLTLSDDEITVIAGSTYKVYSYVEPWGTDDLVHWSSADETVATVNAKGVITAVAAGETVITAVADADENAVATVKVTVKEIVKTLNGLVWDERGDVWVSEFTTNQLPDYTKLNKENLGNEIASFTYDKDGTAYVASFDSENFVSTLYTMDTETFKLTKIGDSELSFMDLAPAPALNALYAVYGNYVLVIDKTTAQYVGAFDLSSFTGGANLVGVAYAESFMNTYYNLPVDWVFVIDEKGNLYETGFIDISGNGDYGRFSVYSDGNIGAFADLPYFQSLYFDMNGDIIFSNFVESFNNVGIYVGEYDGEAMTASYYVGSFADSVWPVGGIYEDGAARVFYYDDFLAQSIGGHATEAIVAEGETEIAPVSFNKDAAPKGAVNAVIDKGEVARPNTRSLASGGIIADIKADGGETNGLYVINYDPEVYYFDSGMVYSDVFAYTLDEENGEIVIAFANAEEFEAGMMIISNTFTKIGEDSGVIMATTEELNDTKPGTTEYLFEGEQPYAMPFVDVPETAWFYNAVKWALDNEITAGTDETHFSPNNALTRAQFVTFLYAMAGKPEVETSENPFEDVAAGKWYTKAVLWAYENGITAGTDATHFSPNDTVTREQTVTFLYAFAGKPEATGSNPFKDVKNGKWYTNAVIWAYENGITYGTGADTFGFGNICTRAQTVTFLYAFDGYLSAIEPLE